MTAKEKLSQIKRIDTLIKNKTIEKNKAAAKMLENATSITSSTDGERVQSSGSKQKMADTVDSGVDRVRRIEKRIAELEAERDSIIAVIEQLPEDEYDILHGVYVQHLTLKQVAANRGQAYSTVAHKHIKGLDMVSCIMQTKAI